MENKKILVIEDDELNMKLITTLLEIGKYCVLEAADAETGIKLAREQKPDLILMDLQLPRMDGLKATQIINEDLALTDIPVVALTGYATEGDQERAMNAGCQGYITKPINTKGFLTSIAQHF